MNLTGESLIGVVLIAIAVVGVVVLLYIIFENWLDNNGWRL